MISPRLFGRLSSQVLESEAQAATIYHRSRAPSAGGSWPERRTAAEDRDWFKVEIGNGNGNGNGSQSRSPGPGQHWFQLRHPAIVALSWVVVLEGGAEKGWCCCCRGSVAATCWPNDSSEW